MTAATNSLLNAGFRVWVNESFMADFRCVANYEASINIGAVTGAIVTGFGYFLAFFKIAWALRPANRVKVENLS